MTNFIFKSTAADLQKIYQFLLVINKNVLYLTRQTDLCVKWLKEERHDVDLQTTVDKYFEDRDEPPVSEDKNDLD